MLAFVRGGILRPVLARLVQVSYAGGGGRDSSQALSCFCFIETPPLTVKKDPTSPTGVEGPGSTVQLFASMSGRGSPEEEKNLGSAKAGMAKRSALKSLGVGEPKGAKRQVKNHHAGFADEASGEGGKNAQGPVVLGADERNFVAGYSNGMVRVWTGWQASKNGEVEELMSFKGAEGVPILGMHYIASSRCVVMASAKGGHYNTPQMLSMWLLDKLAAGEQTCARPLRGEKITTHESFAVSVISAECLVIGYEDGAPLPCASCLLRPPKGPSFPHPSPLPLFLSPSLPVSLSVSPPLPFIAWHSLHRACAYLYASP